MFRSIQPREFLTVLAIVALTAAVGLMLPRGMQTVRAGENWLNDFRFGALMRFEPQNADIVVIAITEDTLATLPYRSPVDRGFLSTLLKALDAAEPRAIGIDILFDQPTETDKDDRLKETLRGLKVPVIVASARTADGLTAEQAKYLAQFTDGINTAPVNLVKDRADGVVRWIFAGRKKGGALTPGFAGALAKAAGLSVPQRDMPLVYRHGPNQKTPAFRIFQAHAAALLPKAWFKGKVVLIGADLPLTDRHRTPFAAAFGGQAGDLPGVVIFAHAVAQLMDGREPPTLNLAGEVALMVAVAGIGMLLAAFDAPLGVKGFVFLTILFVLWLGGFAAYRYGGVMIPLLAQTLSVVTSTSLGLAYLGKRDREQKKFIRGAFSRYVSPAIVDLLVERPEKLKLGGEKRELTYLFTDLADFTSFTERTEPRVLVPLLNDYLNTMCGILFDHGATVDKIVGDAVVGFFNAPVDQSDHALRAVSAALAMDLFGQRFIKEQAARGLALGITRIGVHSGTAVIGNFGGDRFFDYTAFGDMVNTAARLESVNKYLGTRVCVSGVTAAQCPESAFRPVGSLVLKGKSEGLDVFEPLHDGAENSPATAAYMDAFERLRRNDTNAIDAFREIVESSPDDGLAQFHLHRLENGETGETILMEEK